MERFCSLMPNVTVSKYSIIGIRQPFGYETYVWAKVLVCSMGYDMAVTECKIRLDDVFQSMLDPAEELFRARKAVKYVWLDPLTY